MPLPPDDASAGRLPVKQQLTLEDVVEIVVERLRRMEYGD
jgi:hypothetical protein